MGTPHRVRFPERAALAARVVGAVLLAAGIAHL
jgi:hypothetical protein